MAEFSLTEREQFFYDNAPYSWNTREESQEHGHAVCAILLAQAEIALERSDAYVAWENDPEADAGDRQWIATLYKPSSPNPFREEPLAASCGIDFAEHYEITPAEDPQARVIAAQLALEAGLRY